ncbi:MFS transporter [Sphingomonas oleivorans]|uniref:MFS transporter n=1 Tax=Sphingomonas oleivorans TaxID=1735121 RepID=A0A2T5FY44_9SPHN|nr:DHA2 family efflux MFS transporter permease subunit [Sphingomonas oleivorans]PTQ11451.1 MFS transporter [Sphingomonas oleivorans]
MASPSQSTPLSGPALLLAGLVLSITNFMVVLDLSIANVAVPHIAGSIGISPTQGTWVITSYAVAEAICVPLTGWLAQRFGAVRTFVFAVIGFGIFSVLCGLSTSLTMLVLCRIGQGFCGGPLMPLSQTLLLRVFPKEKHGAAMGMWGMTTVVGPIAGPLLGGYISDNYSWHWIFFINIPVALLCSMAAWRLLRKSETPAMKARIDRIGLALLIIWVGALQIMLDTGREHDWFGSPMIVALAAIAAIFFVAFMIWELTEEHPIVDLRVFRHRGFSASVLALGFAFGTFFASVVVLPQWLQGSLGYTATWSGKTTAWIGMFAVILSPVVGRLAPKVDARYLVCFGILWLGFATSLRTFWTTGADYWTLALPQLLQGIGMPFFFVPLTILALAAVKVEETASAAGVMSFVRTLAGAVGTAIASTIWQNRAQMERSELSGLLHAGQEVPAALAARGFTQEQSRALIERLVDQESITLATTYIFALASAIFMIAAMLIWLVPRPRRAVDTSAAH